MQEEEDKQVERIAVLGAGRMGGGIAQVSAAAGYQVILRDLHMNVVQEAIQGIADNLAKMAQQGLSEPSQHDQVLQRIRGTTDLSELSEADMVIEAVVENMAVKKQIFAELDHICKDQTILASNTSSLSISEIAAATRRTGQVLGMHFFNPVPGTELVELVKGMETSDETVHQASRFCERIGKHHVLVNRETPGYIVNRVLIPYINEAIFVYGEGMATKEEIDTAMKLGLGMKQGPLELADRIGLDTLNEVIQSFLHEFRDNKYRPHTLLATMIRAGYLGKKSGRGFYHY